jgi:hypothetical protein
MFCVLVIRSDTPQRIFYAFWLRITFSENYHPMSLHPIESPRSWIPVRVSKSSTNIEYPEGMCPHTSVSSSNPDHFPRPEQKYQGTNGIAAFVGLWYAPIDPMRVGGADPCASADEINKSSAYMTEAYLLANSPKVRRANDPTLAPFCVAFGTAHLGVDYFGWLEGETIRSGESNSSRYSRSLPLSI